MSAQQVQRSKSLEEEVKEWQDALLTTLFKKAYELASSNDEAKRKQGEAYYMLYSVLRELEVKETKNPALVAATDGRKIFVGQLLPAVVEKYGKSEHDKAALYTATLLHEALHVLFGHPYRLREATDPLLYNIVADLYVNTVLKEKVGIDLPDAFVTFRSFVKFVESQRLIDTVGDPKKRERLEKLIQELGEEEVTDKLTVDQVYNILARLPKNTKDIIKERMQGKLTGNDLADENGRPLSHEPGEQDEGGEEGREESSKQGGGGKEKRSNRGGSREQSKAKKGGGEGEQEPTAPTGEEGDTSLAGSNEQDNSSEPGSSAVPADNDELEAPSPAPGQGGLEVPFGEASEEGGRELDKLRRVQDELERIRRMVERAKGEYEGMVRNEQSQGRGAGHGEGVAYTAEYKKISDYLIPIEKAFFAEVSATHHREYLNIADHDPVVFWVPKVDKKYVPQALALIDASPSVPERHTLIFVNLIERAASAYKIEYTVSIFSTGELGVFKVTPQGADARLKMGVPRGFGTAFDESVAKRIRDAAAKRIRLIQILSDFDIYVSDEALKAIQEFKRVGGKVSCYSSTGAFLDFCDYRHTLPQLPA